jgi:four helix bundle protein
MAFPEEERFGLTSQLRRAAASIGANIAEGCGRSTDTDMCRYLQIALGSACEVLNHALLARDLGYLGQEEFLALERELSPVRGMLLRLIARLRQSGRGSRQKPSRPQPQPKPTAQAHSPQPIAHSP